MSITEAPRLSFPKWKKQKVVFFPCATQDEEREKSLFSDRASEQHADTKKAPLANNLKLLKKK